MASLRSMRAGACISMAAALLASTLVAAGPAAAQQADGGMTAHLRRADPDDLIDLQLRAARTYAAEGLTDAAIAAYETALLSILQFRGQGHIDLAQPMVEVARLSEATAVQIAWLAGAAEIRDRAGQGRPSL